MAEEHHYVSRCLLEGFTAPKEPERPEPFLFVADLQERRVYRRAPQKVARIRDYYAVPTVDGAIDYSVERAWGRVEDRAAPVLRRLRGADESISSDDLSWLLALAAVHFGRVPRVREAARRLRLDFVQRRLDVLGADRHALESMAGGGVDGEQLDRVQQVLSDRANYEMTLDKHGGIQESIRAAEIAGEEFSRMRWECLKPQDGGRFITSDCPASPFNARANATMGHGLAAPRVEVTFPLTPSLCLLGTWHGEHLAHYRVEDAEVAKINTRLVYFATRYCFAGTEALAEWAVARRLSHGAVEPV
jgi:hypothetical protein